MPINPLVKLFIATIFTNLILFKSNIIGSIAYLAVSYFIVFNLALELIRLKNYIPLILIGTFRYSYLRYSTSKA